MSKISSHRKNDSGELDVFEAARYFSGANEDPCYYQPAKYKPEKIIREDTKYSQRAGRMSLDMPMMRNVLPAQIYPMERNKNKENKKHKPPSSPGAKLASFLNSLFNQTSSKKKKSKSISGAKDLEDDSGRRKRRSSISHFTLNKVLNNDDSKSFYSSFSSGFRTPPPYANTPIKSYKEFKSFSDHPKVPSLPNPRLENELKRTEMLCLDEKFSFNNRISEKMSKNSDERDFRKMSVDDGAESDSSSDLFDLPNHDLDFYPTGLPVYETTYMDRIQIGTQISSFDH